MHHRGPYNVVFRCRLSAVNSKEYILIHGIGNWQTMPDGTKLAVISYANLTASMRTIQEDVKSYGLLQKDRFYTDYLTELPNINYMHEFGREKVDRICSDGHTPMLIYSDVESMKSYNNQYGLEEGDHLLCLIAETLKERFPKSLVTRGADDHFVTITDVDNFKSINDTYGHKTGDKVLVKLVRTLKENFRSDDYVCRIGGDEFVVLSKLQRI